MSDRSKAENRRLAGGVWVDSTWVQKPEVTLDGLRGVLEAVGRDPHNLRWPHMESDGGVARAGRRLQRVRPNGFAAVPCLVFPAGFLAPAEGQPRGWCTLNSLSCKNLKQEVIVPARNLDLSFDAMARRTPLEQADRKAAEPC